MKAVLDEKLLTVETRIVRVEEKFECRGQVKEDIG